MLELSENFHNINHRESMRICWKLLNGNHDCERKFHFITACRPHSHHYHRYSRLPRCFAFLCYAFDITSPSLSFYDTQKTTRAESCCVVAKNNLFDTQLRNGERKEFCGKLRNVWRRSYNKWQAIVKFQYRVNPKCVALFWSQILEWRPLQVQTMSCCWIKNFSVLSAGIWCWSKHSYECLRSNARTKKNKQFSQFSCHCLNSDKLEIFFHLTRILVRILTHIWVLSSKWVQISFTGIEHRPINCGTCGSLPTRWSYFWWVLRILLICSCVAKKNFSFSRYILIFPHKLCFYTCSISPLCCRELILSTSEREICGVKGAKSPEEKFCFISFYCLIILFSFWLGNIFYTISAH